MTDDAHILQELLDSIWKEMRENAHVGSEGGRPMVNICDIRGRLSRRFNFYNRIFEGQGHGLFILCIVKQIFW